MLGQGYDRCVCVEGYRLTLQLVVSCLDPPPTAVGKVSGTGVSGGSGHETKTVCGYTVRHMKLGMRSGAMKGRYEEWGHEGGV